MLFKVLNQDGSAVHGGQGSWSLPKGKRPGRWMPKIENFWPCRRGYHVVTLDQLPQWLGPAVFEVEVRGDRVDRDDKIVVGEARLVRRLSWDDRSARLFAADCAEHVLPIFETQFPNDSRPRDAIEVARRFAEGSATSEERAAAWAAWDTAWAAAGAAAGAAAWAAGAAAWAAGAAAWAAAGDAAGAAAWAAAWAAWAAAGAAAGAAERRWQVERLAHYLGVEV